MWAYCLWLDLTWHRKLDYDSDMVMDWTVIDRSTNRRNLHCCSLLVIEARRYISTARVVVNISIQSCTHTVCLAHHTKHTVTLKLHGTLKNYDCTQNCHSTVPLLYHCATSQHHLIPTHNTQYLHVSPPTIKQND